ncbi:KRAB-A domain-containing protein 2-like [Aphis craccivora]|uniref:KRAB-A domain-containing protein 2-like n=1 Tax=Aphis craccivora TaxID=307492 RepID=A0A6G0VIB0_APHCR|nr:KRAB-A domain-containing protein 2-like [Aphis craccivora]
MYRGSVVQWLHKLATTRAVTSSNSAQCKKYSAEFSVVSFPPAVVLVAYSAPHRTHSTRIEVHTHERAKESWNTPYSRNQFTTCKEKLVTIEEVPDLTITLREAMRKYSNLGGQGYDR